MRVRFRRRYLVLVLLVLGVSTGLGFLNAARHKKKKTHRPSKTPVVQIDYASEIRPILEAHCYRCHGPTNSKAGLRLDTPAGIRKGSDNDVVIVPGDGAHIARLSAS